MSYLNAVRTTPQDNAGIDAFGRQRVSEPVTLFDGKLVNDSHPLIWDDQQVTGSGTTSTHSTDESTQTLAVGATTSGHRVRQTKRRFNYQAGKSHMILITTNFNGGNAGNIKEVGYFDDENGIFYRLNGTTMNIVCRSSVSGGIADTVVAQDSWNVDKMDGTGPSGITLDWTKTQILFFDLEWLGVGRVRCGVVIDGIIYMTHQFLNANNLTLPYMTTPNLPIRYSIENGGSGPADDLVCICASVASEAGHDPVGMTRGIFSNDSLSGLANTAAYPLISMRLKSTHLDAVLQILGLSAVSSSQESRVFRVSVLLNGTITNPTAWGGLADSSVEVMLPTTTGTTIANGTVLASFVVSGRESITIPAQDAEVIGSSIAGTSDVLSLVVEPITNSISVYTTLNWRELA